MRERTWSWSNWFLFLLTVVLGAGCAGPFGQSPQDGSIDANPQIRSGPKSITIVLPIDPTALAGSMSGLGAAAVPTRYFK